MGRAKTFLVAAALMITLATAGCGEKESGGAARPTTVSGARVSWGDPASGDPRGVVMLIPGGGWQRTTSTYEEQKASAPAIQAKGFATVTVGYDTGAKGFQQVVDVFKKAREAYPGLPICASGISAGANYALLLAAHEPELKCVVAVAAPTDLTTIAAQDPEGEEAYQAAVTAFGQDQLARFSPVRFADKIKAKVLLVVAVSDPVVPEAQGQEFARALPGTKLIVVPPGPVSVPFAHYGGVPSGAQESLLKSDFDFLGQNLQGKQGN